ncbi:hypothetical protein [Robertkochia solimangrovi]|uniref:hypothetical protein n=1 Tax=Robertkochia solimangrovi TaxID=2213046 RepID=UPI001181230D|nr:hypothetical protein [Robertkochia solimangrovi]TRZ43977.1 hypothetical protein DMZ48_08470 [Robertkochia solimangrovi]
MNQKTHNFESPGFPSIQIFEDHFEIKAIDHWEYRTFAYLAVKKIKYFNPNNQWWNRIMITTSFFANNDPLILKIILKNGGDWTYVTSNKYNPDFRKTINQIQSRCSI